MANQISDLELEVLNEILSIGRELKNPEYKKKLIEKGVSESKYKEAEVMINYINSPQDGEHYRSSIELKYLTPDEEITIWFSDGKHYWSNIPKEFTGRITKKLYQEGQ
jgi:tRNA G10  N-methylase Trm11